MSSRTARPTSATVTLHSLTMLGAAFLWTFVLDARLYAGFVWPVLALGLVALGAAAAVASGAQWTLLLGGAVGAVVLVTAFREPFVIMRLTEPETAWTFLATGLIIGSAAVSAVAGCAAALAVSRTTAAADDTTAAAA